MKMGLKNIVDPMVNFFILYEEWKLKCKLAARVSSKIALQSMLVEDKYNDMIVILTLKFFSLSFTFQWNQIIFFIFLFLFLSIFSSSKHTKWKYFYSYFHSFSFHSTQISFIFIFTSSKQNISTRVTSYIIMELFLFYY